MNLPICIIFAVLPSIIWLLFYLRKDVHPESVKMILKIFCWGMILALPAVLLEEGFAELLKEGLFKFKIDIPVFLFLILGDFLGVAFIEEFLKFLVVRGHVLKNPEFDEPLDAMLYMIIAALGFAAIENILILFSFAPDFLIGKVFPIYAFRFLGATFLHALCSGLVGYFLALSFFETKKRGKLILMGLTIAVFLHGLFNFSIMYSEGNLKVLIPALIIISLAVFLTFAFKRLKKIRSVCKI